jgi:hypothetical protein
MSSRKMVFEVRHASLRTKRAALDASHASSRGFGTSGTTRTDRPLQGLANGLKEQGPRCEGQGMVRDEMETEDGTRRAAKHQRIRNRTHTRSRHVGMHCQSHTNERQKEEIGSAVFVSQMGIRKASEHKCPRRWAYNSTRLSKCSLGNDHERETMTEACRKHYVHQAMYGSHSFDVSAVRRRD